MSLRRTDGKIDEDLVWSTTGVDMFEPSLPWRTFRWRYGQKHYSGTYWSSTMRDHVVYESRLELTRLLYADFDQDVTAVFAQPFLLSTTVEGRRRRHVPDFLVLREKDVPLVVDVKPRHLSSGRHSLVRGPRRAGRRRRGRSRPARRRHHGPAPHSRPRLRRHRPHAR
jgi:hypothetical protein